MCASTTSPTYATMKIVETSYPVYYVDTAILIPFPAEEAKTMIIVASFQGKVQQDFLYVALFNATKV